MAASKPERKLWQEESMMEAVAWINCNIRHQLTHAFFALRYTYTITIIENTPT